MMDISKLNEHYTVRRMNDADAGNSFLRAVFEEQRAMIDIEPDNTYMTVFDPDSRLPDQLRALAAAKGLFCGVRRKRG